MNRRMFGGGPVPVLLIALIIVVASFAASQSARAESKGDCVTARVETAFRLPDGALHPAGTLTLCDTRTFSPVADLHTILVNGSSIGVFQSRKRRTETGGVDAPQIVFQRDFDGSLELVGYILPSRGRSIAYRLNGTGESWQANLPLPTRGTPAPATAIIAAVDSH